MKKLSPNCKLCNGDLYTDGKTLFCQKCDFRPAPKDCRTIGQYMEVVGLAHKFASYKADKLTEQGKGFIAMACTPELEIMKLRAMQLKQLKQRREGV